LIILFERWYCNELKFRKGSIIKVQNVVLDVFFLGFINKIEIALEIRKY